MGSPGVMARSARTPYGCKLKPRVSSLVTVRAVISTAAGEVTRCVWIVKSTVCCPAGTTTVPVPDHHELKIGTLLSIIRQSGLPRSEFET